MESISESVEPNDVASATNILLNSSVPTDRGIYVLGSYEDRVTIHSQQIRAFNLIYALKRAGQIREGTTVAVIGAGIGGLTAAAAAGALTANVTLFERHSEVLHNLRGCHTRYLHPNVYDWPSDTALVDRTKLPFLNWSAGTADKVAAELLDEWEKLAASCKIDVRSAANVYIHELSAGGRRVTVSSPEFEMMEFAVVILATGFGVEATIPPQPLRSYWRDDSLHQPEIEPRTVRTHYLVSGNGDGGLIDILRLRLRDFRHEDLLREFESSARLAGVTSTLDEIEEEVRTEIGLNKNPAETLYNRYRRRLPALTDLDRLLESRLREDTRVTFNYTDYPLTHRSSIFHRLIVFRLLSIDKQLRALPGRIISVDGHEPSLTVTIQTDSGKVVQEVHRVVLRHGPMSSLLRDFPDLHQRFEPTLRARNAVDTTRKRIWPEGFFGKSRVENDAIENQAEPATNVADHAGSETTGIAEAKGFKMLRTTAEARRLRDALIAGNVSRLDEEVKKLSSSDLAFLYKDLVDRAGANENALSGLKDLFDVNRPTKEQIGPVITSLVKSTLGTTSLSRYARILEFGSFVLRFVETDTLLAFFREIFAIIRRDQFSEVNILVPRLIAVQDALPRAAIVEYVESLLNQRRSSAFIAGPAAKKALDNLSAELVQAFIEDVDVDLLLKIHLYDGIHELLKSHEEMVEEINRGIVNDYLALDYFAFEERHSGADQSGSGPG